MLIESPIALLAACTAGAATINLAMLKLSPTIKARMRHAIAGTGPAVASLGAMIGVQDSVVATGTDLLVLGGSVAFGLAASIGSTKFVTPKRAIAQV
ncbi:hypothetical protein [Qipengyuania nanhaisediminis]|uniref:hypothetical protein n=1 Tax=Qipengyuania nanhaisediminis TaxID=604088 RepID=UPI0038B23DA1